MEALLILVCIALVGQALFGGWLPRRLDHYPLDFLCIPLLVWVAFRFSQREVATAVLILSGIALSGTVAGFGPFSGATQNDSLLLLQAFLGLAAVMILAFAAVVSESRRGHEATARMSTALLAQEQAARGEAEAGNRAKDEFLAILSHELRTPLNAVYGWARMMQAGQLDAETTARALDAIVRNSDLQVKLIDDLLDVSRVISGKMRLDVRRVDVREVVEAALDALGPSAEAKGLRLEGVLDPRGGIVDGDPGRLQQVVSNLVMNAVKFTPAGGHVQVRLRQDRETVEIVVSDTGQGNPADVLPFVFDRFRQWDSSSTRAHSGLGLGLALVKHLTELHRGTVCAESAGEGKGATFRVTLPLAAPRLPDTPAKTADPALGAGARLQGLRVLAVDDEPDALALTTTILGNAGAIVRTCSSAAAALAILPDWWPDILVSDIDMPGENGYSLIRKVRALDEKRGALTPAVALTAYGRSEDRVQSLSSGYNMHVPKPVDPAEFTAIIASVARVFRPARRDL